MRGVGLLILSLGIASLLGAVVIAAASGLIVMAMTLAIACVLLAPIGVAALRAARRAAAIDPLRGEARVIAVVGTGISVGGGTEVVLDLDVSVPGRPSYRATVASVVPDPLLQLCAAGRTIPVLVDRADPSGVSVDWAAERG